MKLSVMIPTYRRPDALDLCLDGLAKQTRKADQIVVVARPDDEVTNEVLSKWEPVLPITRAMVSRPGQIQALNEGLNHVAGDIVAITDDDSRAYPEWLSLIEKHFMQDSRLGGLGGRDIVHDPNGVAIPASSRLVGRILPFGKVVGNHHIGLGETREVDHIKGVNMSWRMAAVGEKRFDPDLRGEGAQVHCDFAFSLAVKGRGWKLLYDPAVKVDHYPAPRFDIDQRNAPSLRAIENASFNFYLLLLRYLRSGWKRWAAIVWARTVGTANAPGMFRGLLYRLKNDRYGMDLRAAAARAWDAARSMQTQKT